MLNRINTKFTINAFWIMLGRIFQIVLTFITTMLVSRYLGPTEYGQITLAFSYVAIFMPIANLGLNDIIVKELIDNKDRNNEIIGTTIIVRMASSFLSMIAVFVIIRVMSNNPILPYLGLIQAISLLFQTCECIMYFYQSKLLSKKTGTIYAISYTLTSIFRIICLILKKDIYWFAFAVTLDYIAIAILLLTTYFKDGNKLVFSKNTAKTLIKKSSPYLFSGVMTVISGKADSILLGKFIDETSVGYYSAATTLCNAWPFVLTAIIDSASPIIISLYNEDRELYRLRIKQLYASIFYIGAFVAIVFTLLSNFIITLIYGEAYIQAAVPLKIASWSTIFSYFGVARFIWAQCENKQNNERKIALFGMIFNVVSNIILINLFGINGAAITLLLTQLFMNFIVLFFIKDTRENAKLILNAIILNGIK